MRSRANLPVFIAYVVIGLLATAFLAAQMGGEFVFGGYRVNAIFKTGADLVAGDEVTMAGLRVGKVESLTPMAGSSEVSLLLHRDFTPLFRDARAVIRQKNLLGETYIEVNRGDASQGAIADGGTINEDHTLTPVEVDQVLNALDPQVRDQLNIVINTLGQATAGRGQDMNASAADLSSVAVDLQALAHTLANNSDHLDALIADLRKVMETLAAWHADFRALIADWDHVMATLAAREQNLQGTIVEQDRVMAILDQALGGGAAEQLHGAIAEGPAAVDNASHYLGGAATTFAVVQQDTPGIKQLFIELASVMSGVGHPDEAGSDSHSWVHMWRVFCANQCFTGG
ncbi:MAG: MCE family protein [Chloroflexi bacterium]|nr:MAG: MCE family protein [Chloroflexota bacterium]